MVGDLETLNTVRQEDIVAYRANNRKLKRQVVDRVNEIANYDQQLQDYLRWLDKFVEKVKRDEKLDDQFFGKGAKYKFDKTDFEKSVPPLTIDRALMISVLDDYNYIHFSRKRKRALRWISLLFRGRIFITISLKLIISFVSGFGFEKLCQLLMPDTPEVVVVVVAGGITFLLIDKRLDRGYNHFFWARVRKQILHLFHQFSVYLKQTALLLEARKQQS